jgi:hypothetical protein
MTNLSKWNLVLSVILFTFSQHAVSEEIKLNDGYCQKALDDFQKEALNNENHLALRNQGGLFGGGVCWWHSRLQRNAIYMARLVPGLPRPDREQAKQIVSDLINEKGPVVVPGYKTIAEFSREFEDVIQKKLEGWQKKDAIFKFSWIKGLKGDNDRSPEKIKKEMDKLYQIVGLKKEIAFVKIQLPGVVAHSLLIVGMKKAPQGYSVQYLDSNGYEVLTHEYREGEVAFPIFGDSAGGGIYMGYTKTMKKLRENFKRACGRELN